MASTTARLPSAVLNSSPTWTENLALVLILYVTLIGAAVGVRDAGHIGMDSLLVMLPDRMRERIELRVVEGVLRGPVLRSARVRLRIRSRRHLAIRRRIRLGRRRGLRLPLPRPRPACRLGPRPRGHADHQNPR